MIKIYGIPNCDTMKKAFDWLKANKIDYEFHNYKTEGLYEEKIHLWLKALKPDQIANTKSTTWKSFSDEEKQFLANADKLSKLLVNNTSAIKRPMVETGTRLMAGFDAAVWEKELK